MLLLFARKARDRVTWSFLRFRDVLGYFILVPLLIKRRKIQSFYKDIYAIVLYKIQYRDTQTQWRRLKFMKKILSLMEFSDGPHSVSTVFYFGLLQFFWKFIFWIYPIFLPCSIFIFATFSNKLMSLSLNLITNWLSSGMDRLYK